jgi:membrane protein implicated in regulation of membrane protease activity
LVGAVLYGITYSQVFPVISKIANVGNVVLPDLWNLNPYLVVFLFALMSVLLFYLIDRAGLHRNEKSE